ncbi:MAG: GAF domain-containing protein [Treponema sp.]|jgi:GAF domain-containing protein|nr:GAF domain-containing protein [Treponema sp.]
MVTVQKEANAEENLAALVKSVESLLEGEEDPIAALANISAAIYAYLPQINWAGFYLLKGKDLVLGPFQGLPACSRIGEGKGVCGAAVRDRGTLIVEDVHAFPGHIACDSASASEIVVPLFVRGTVRGVLDIDSPVPGRFTALEKEYLEQIGKCAGAFLESRDPEAAR